MVAVHKGMAANKSQTLMIVGPQYESDSHIGHTVDRANDVRIDCKAAKHSDGDRGALCAPHREWPRRKRAALRARIALAVLLAGGQTSAALSISCSSWAAAPRDPLELC